MNALLKKLFGSHHGLAVAVWALAWLAAFDIGVNLAFGPDRPPDRQSSLTRYFEYGRSVEGKLDRMVAADPNTGGQMVRAGWTEPQILAALPKEPEPGKDLLMAVYGQSFALIASREAARLDGRVTLRGVGGPGAPPSHSYAGYLQDAPLRKADVVVFGVLSSAVPAMGSLSGMFWLFENPSPFTFPRYRVSGDRLTEVKPLIESEADFREAFATRTQRWKDFKTQLRQNDRGYDSFTLEANAADRSAIVRLVRRGWVAHSHAYEDGVYDPATGFNPQAEDVQALKAMLVDLGRRTRERGEHLVVLLLHTRGQSDHLRKAVGPALEAAGIDYLSTDSFFSANDPQNFLADGHYVPVANDKLSKALAQRLRARTNSRAAPVPVSAEGSRPDTVKPAR